MDNRTITLKETFFGEQKLTKKEFISRWKSPALSIWTLFLDHGTTQEERDFGRSIFDRTEIKAGELFEKFYEEEQNK
jgi:hypothetical protein